MRCPKCHYLSFDPEPRCKNCGYDLEVDDADLALRAADPEPEDAPMPDLMLRQPANTAAASVTLELVPAKTRRSAVGVVEQGSEGNQGSEGARQRVREARLGRERRRVLDDADEIPARQIFADVIPEAEPQSEATPVARVGLIEPEEEISTPISVVPVVPVVPDVPVLPVGSTPPEPRTPFRSPHTTSDLPLFVKGIADREELRDKGELGDVEQPESILPPARPPLAVRRAAPESPRVRSVVADRRIGPLDNDLLEDLKRVEREETERRPLMTRDIAPVPQRPVSVAVEETGLDLPLDDDESAVEPGTRVAAAAIDVAVLGSIASFVFWATLRLCNISVADLGMASLVPLGLFLALMDVGYLLMFTAAGGQTVGKMVMGIRVVTEAESIGSPSLGQAAWRAVLTIASVAVLGLSWLPALIGRGPALHDRLAHTRVVRA